MSMRRTPETRISRQHSTYSGFTGSDPSDSESDENFGPTRAFSAPPLSKWNSKVSPFRHTEDGGSGTASFKPMDFSAAKGRYKNEFCDSRGFENQPLQEVQNYDVYMAEETTQNLNHCLKIAEEMRERAASPLVYRTHLTAASMEQDLSLGEKLLGSLGGLFSKTWKLVRSQQIKGPSIVRDESFMRRSSHMEQRQRLGLSALLKVQSNPRQHPSQPTTTLGKIEFEKSKQDDILSKLSDLLGELKEMALDMGSEIGSRKKGLDHLPANCSRKKGLDHLRDDVDTLNDNRSRSHLLAPDLARVHLLMGFGIQDYIRWLDPAFKCLCKVLDYIASY